MEIEVKGIEKGFIISVTSTSIALIVKSCEHEPFVGLLFTLIAGRSLKNCCFGSVVVSVPFT